MKAFTGIICAIAIVLSIPLAAQEGAPDKDHQKQEEPKKQSPSEGKREGQPQEKPKSKPQNPPQPASGSPQQKSRERQAPNGRGQQPERSARGNGSRIPPERFEANFGSQHRFHMENLEGGRRFRQAGFLFELVEPWPADWSFQDDCFIERDLDDYYLVDVLHPGIRVLVIVIEG